MAKTISEMSKGDASISDFIAPIALNSMTSLPYLFERKMKVSSRPALIMHLSNDEKSKSRRCWEAMTDSFPELANTLDAASRLYNDLFKTVTTTAFAVCSKGSEAESQLACLTASVRKMLRFMTGGI
jgi:hypothetical protein